MALRNTVRHPARFWLSVGLLASAGTVFVAELNSGTEAVNEQRDQQRYWDVEAALARPAPTGAVTSALQRVPGVSRVQAWNREPIGVAGPGQLPFTRTYSDQGHGSIAINTVPAGATEHPTPPTCRRVSVVRRRLLRRGGLHVRLRPAATPR